MAFLTGAPRAGAKFSTKRPGSLPILATGLPPGRDEWPGHYTFFLPPAGRKMACSDANASGVNRP